MCYKVASSAWSVMQSALYPITSARRASSAGMSSPSLKIVCVCKSIMMGLHLVFGVVFGELVQLLHPFFGIFGLDHGFAFLQRHTSLFEDLLPDQDRALRPDRQGYCVGGTAVDAPGSPLGIDDDLSVERAILDVRDLHAGNDAAQVPDGVEQQVMGRGAGKRDLVERHGNGHGLHGPDPDGQDAAPLLALEDDDGRFVVLVQRQAEYFHCHHGTPFLSPTRECFLASAIVTGTISPSNPSDCAMATLTMRPAGSRPFHQVSSPLCMRLNPSRKATLCAPSKFFRHFLVILFCRLCKRVSRSEASATSTLGSMFTAATPGLSEYLKEKLDSQPTRSTISRVS
eukprot:TRINITY_DN3669_c0_g2_i4.p1 TRINITY_DN3669_c0_g2~~TRINITY_DN3669_c0_g2_i4.p1  ORF type:complete len:342 (+),score=69.85 TRINITY_DN3669_c0_g2_i4:673-1698(+)